MLISIIAAASENNVIGKDNDLIWHLPDDMAFFKEKTSGHCVLMGRKNYESIPERFPPLPNRPNIVVSRGDHPNAKDRYYVKSLEEGIEKANELGERELFVIGGGEIYRQAISLANKLYLTRVHHDFDGDTYFPDLDESLWKEKTRRFHDKDERHSYAMTFLEYEKE